MEKNLFFFYLKNKIKKKRRKLCLLYNLFLNLDEYNLLKINYPFKIYYKAKFTNVHKGRGKIKSGKRKVYEGFDYYNFCKEKKIVHNKILLEEEEFENLFEKVKHVIDDTNYKLNKFNIFFFFYYIGVEDIMNIVKWKNNLKFQKVKCQNL